MCIRDRPWSGSRICAELGTRSLFRNTSPYVSVGERGHAGSGHLGWSRLSAFWRHPNQRKRAGGWMLLHKFDAQSEYWDSHGRPVPLFAGNDEGSRNPWWNDRLPNQPQQSRSGSRPIESSGRPDEPPVLVGQEEGAHRSRYLG